MLDKEPDLQLERELKFGPKKERKSTDIIFCLLFVGFWAASLFIIFDSSMKGDFTKIARPYDSDGRPCGFNFNGTDATQYPYLFFGVPGIFDGGLLAKTVCVSQCPTADNQTLKCLTTTHVTDCSQVQSYSSYVLMKRFCIPNEQTMLEKVASLFSGFNLESIIESMILNKWIILSSVGIAFLLGYFFTFVLQYCTWLLVIISIAGIFAVGIFLSISSWKKYHTIKAQPVDPNNPSSQGNITSSANFYKWVAIGLWAGMGLLALSLCCLFNRIRLAVKVITAAADFVQDYKHVVFIPIILMAIAAAFVAAWCYGLAAIFSTGDIYWNSEYPWGKIRYTGNMQ